MPTSVRNQATKLGVSVWITIGSFILALLGIGSALLTQLFTPQSQFADHELANTKSMGGIQMAAEKLEGTNQLRDWKIQNIQVKVDNLEARQARIDTNVVRLLTRFGAAPVPEPQYLNPPPAPMPTPQQ
jgi:hypothetical protein